MADLRIANVMRTNDYTKFRHLNGNRDVGIRAEKIKKKIKEVGYILCPIVVNEKMEVIDGQGRLKALSDLGLPVDYVIAKGTGLQECIAMNLGQTNWTVTDFINSYAEQGNANYINLKKVIGSTKLKTSVVIGIARQVFVTGGETLKPVMQGSLKFDDVTETIKIIQKVEKFNDILKGKGGNINHSFLALAFLFRNHIADDVKLYNKCLKYEGTLRGTLSTIDALQLFEDIYNFRSREKAYFVHEFKVYQDEKKRNSKRG